MGVHDGVGTCGTGDEADACNMVEKGSSTPSVPSGDRLN
jgi:hypothetical protein